MDKIGGIWRFDDRIGVRKLIWLNIRDESSTVLELKDGRDRRSTCFGMVDFTSAPVWLVGRLPEADRCDVPTGGATP